MSSSSATRADRLYDALPADREQDDHVQRERGGRVPLPGRHPATWGNQRIFDWLDEELAKGGEGQVMPSTGSGVVTGAGAGVFSARRCPDRRKI